MKTKQILIVDDDDHIRFLLSTFLNERGYETEDADNGESALRWLNDHEPDLVLLDIRMPGLSGIEVLERAHQRYPNLPVIVISGYADEAMARDALRMGAYDFFLKPFDLSTLEMRLSTKLDLLVAPGENV
jgi:two-component system response regulator AtoC